MKLATPFTLRDLAMLFFHAMLNSIWHCAAALQFQPYDDHDSIPSPLDVGTDDPPADKRSVQRYTPAQVLLLFIILLLLVCLIFHLVRIVVEQHGCPFRGLRFKLNTHRLRPLTDLCSRLVARLRISESPADIHILPLHRGEPGATVPESPPLPPPPVHCPHESRRASFQSLSPGSGPSPVDETRSPDFDMNASRQSLAVTVSDTSTMWTTMSDESHSPTLVKTAPPRQHFIY